MINFYVKFQIRPQKGVFFSIYWLWNESPKNSIPLLHFCLKNLNQDVEINLHMADFSMALSTELHEIVFPENLLNTISWATSSTTIKIVSQQLKCKINC